MRSINVGIAVVLIGAVCALSTHGVRRAAALAVLVVWTSMGLYFIASNNPPPWVITGVFTYGVALYGVLNAQGWCRWTLLGMAALASLPCYGSRGDAAFYVFVASPGILTLVVYRRHLSEIGIASVLSVIGIWYIFGSDQSGHIAQSEAPVALRRRIEVVIMNIRYLPEYFAGFIGLDSGPGWRDTPLPGCTTILGLLVLGVALFYRVRTMNLRKILAAFVVFGAMAGTPLLIATPPTFPNLGGYHSRYALPLPGMWPPIWLSCVIKRLSITRGQIVMFVFFLSVVDAVAVYTTITRYVRGLLSIRRMRWIVPGNLNGDIQWWWVNMQLSPTALWGPASLGYTLALTSAIYLPRNRQVEAPASIIPTKEEETA